MKEIGPSLLCHGNQDELLPRKTPNFVFLVAGNATASGFTQLHCTLCPVSCKSRYVQSKSVRSQLSGLNLLVTRSKVFLSSGFGRTWQVRRFSLAGGRLIYRETPRSGRKTWGGISFFKVALMREWIPDVQSSSAFPHRAVRNGQAAKFHSTLSLLPHLPDSAEWIATGGKKQTSVCVEETGKCLCTGWIIFNSWWWASSNFLPYLDTSKLKGWEGLQFDVNRPRKAAEASGY